MKDFEKHSAARRTLDRLKVPKELLANDDYCPTRPLRNDCNIASVTAAVCGDPLPWRSALGGYEHCGDYNPRGPKRWEDNDERLQRRELPKEPLRKQLHLTPTEKEI